MRSMVESVGVLRCDRTMCSDVLAPHRRASGVCVCVFVCLCVCVFVWSVCVGAAWKGAGSLLPGSMWRLWAWSP